MWRQKSEILPTWWRNLIKIHSYRVDSHRLISRTFHCSDDASPAASLAAHELGACQFQVLSEVVQEHLVRPHLASHWSDIRAFVTYLHYLKAIFCLYIFPISRICINKKILDEFSLQNNISWLMLILDLYAYRSTTAKDKCNICLMSWRKKHKESVGI